VVNNVTVNNPAPVISQPTNVKKFSYDIYNNVAVVDNDLVDIKYDFSVSGEAYFNGNISVADDAEFSCNVSVGSDTNFYGTITVKGEANFEVKVSFQNDVDVRGKIYVNRDQAGGVLFKADATSTEIFLKNLIYYTRIVITQE
jgi:hypothetical protein